MTSFLITFKPATENATLGWPVSELRKLVDETKRNGSATENWRFLGRNLAKVGDRVFLLRQGRAGPAIIGYGRVAGVPSTTGQSTVPIHFERLLDPEISVLATAEELMAITSARAVWGTQASGVSLSDDIAQALEHLVVGREPVAVSGRGNFPSPQPRSSIQLTETDFALFVRHPTRRPWGEIPAADQEAYRDLRQRLKMLSEWAASHYPSRVRMRAFQSHPTPNGRNSTELWCCIFPEEIANKSFALQYALIVSAAGVEICFCLGAGEAQTGPQELAPLRADLIRMRAELTQLDHAVVSTTDGHLIADGWQYRRSWRQSPGSADFVSLEDWLRFASSPQGDGASISRNLSPIEATTLGNHLQEEFFAWGAPFAPLFDAAYPAHRMVSAPAVVATPAGTPAINPNVPPPTRPQKVWLIAPGERARLWPDFVKEKIAAIGWDDLGDLREYANKQAIADKIREVYEREGTPTNDMLACFEFSQVMQPGDLIFAKQGTRTLVGVGIIQGPYEFRSERNEYKHVRAVDWTAVGPWQLSDDTTFVVKTLTDITDYPEYVDKLRSLTTGGSPIDGTSKSPPPVDYTLDQFVVDTGIVKEVALSWLSRLRRKKQMIFQGPPGTGKTFVAEKLAWVLASEGEGFVEVVQLHPAYTYEDFILGIRPEAVDGKLSFRYQRGRFLTFCDEATRVGSVSPCVMIIDEINRANLPRVLGELLYLLEYREKRIPLAGSNEELAIPANVYILGTMNTADRSIALVDHALRRRFTFVTLSPDYNVLRVYLERQGLMADALISLLKGINAAIDDPHYEVGISFFMKDGADLPATIEDVWKGEIEPYLEEYFFDSPAKIEPFRWSKIAEDLLPSWNA